MKVLVFFYHDPGLEGILPFKPTHVLTGGYRRLLEIAKRVRKYNVEFVIVESFPSYFSADKRSYNRYQEFKTPAFKLRNSRLTEPWLVALKMANMAKELAENEHFDLILSPSETIEMCLAAYLTSRSTKVPLAAVVHHIDWEKQNHGWLASESLKIRLIEFYYNAHFALDKKLLLHIYNNAQIISVSSSTQESLRSLGVKSKIFVCGNGVDNSQIDDVQTDSLLFDGIFVGRLVHNKGVFEALSVFEAVCSKDNKAKFAFVGEGEPKIMRNLKEAIHKKKMEKNIMVFGYVDEEKKFELMKSSKIFIFPSHQEGWGIAVGEALACGLPVICYDLPAFKELFDCEAVRRCEEGNVNQMITETLRLIQNTEERKKLGLIARDFVKKYDWEEVAKREAQIYNLMIE